MNTDGYNREMKKETSLFEGKHGIILIDKPKNWTSHDCVSLVRKKTGVKRVGHTGSSSNLHRDGYEADGLH